MLATGLQWQIQLVEITQEDTPFKQSYITATVR